MLCAFQFITCKIVFFYLVLLLLHRIGNLLAYVAVLMLASFYGLQASVAEWLVRETQICQVADSNPKRSRVFVNLRLISTFSYFS